MTDLEAEYLSITSLKTPQHATLRRARGAAIDVDVINMDWPKYRVRENESGAEYWVDMHWVTMVEAR